jgi:hypothetical protein
MLLEKGLDLEAHPQESERLKIKVFMFKDPEGYTIEIGNPARGMLDLSVNPIPSFSTP